MELKTVEMIMHNTRSHATLKSVDSGRCLDINESHLNVYGLKNARDVIGLTVWDMNEKMNKFWLDNAFQVEKFETNRTFDLITSATAFYWMDRPLIVNKLQDLLNEHGIFCAYKYDFPIPYGKLRDFINYELATKWAPYRDQRLVDYDNTLEILNDTGIFAKTGRLIVPNIIELTPEEIAYFFLSTSYVTAYIEQSGNHEYYQWFLAECCRIGNNNSVKVNFDINAFYAINS